MSGQHTIEDDMPVDHPDGVSAPKPTAPTVLELAREIEQARLEAGLSIGELLSNLCEQRERYYRDNYGADQTG
ncbi:MAG: hypothetical protein Kow0063_24810 [Anaerolineae bacterium]